MQTSAFWTFEFFQIFKPVTRLGDLNLKSYRTYKVGPLRKFGIWNPEKTVRFGIWMFKCPIFCQTSRFSRWFMSDIHYWAILQVNKVTAHLRQIPSVKVADIVSSLKISWTWVCRDCSFTVSSQLKCSKFDFHTPLSTLQRNKAPKQRKCVWNFQIKFENTKSNNAF